MGPEAPRRLGAGPAPALGLQRGGGTRRSYLPCRAWGLNIGSPLQGSAYPVSPHPLPGSDVAAGRLDYLEDKTSPGGVNQEELLVAQPQDAWPPQSSS